MRTCSKATKAKLSKIPRVFPSEWVRVAYYDAMNGKPMSAERERKMMVALGIAKPPRTREVGSRTVKIKLTQTIKADPKHGLFAGCVFDATIATGKKTTARWQVVSDAGASVEIFSAEAEIVVP